MTLNIERGLMEKEKLKDKILNLISWNAIGIDKVLLVLFFLTDLFYPILSVLFLLMLMFILSKNTSDNGLFIQSTYLIIPTFCHIYVLYNINTSDFILWLFLLLFAVKITIYVFNNVFDDVTDTKKYALFGLFGSVLVASMIGIISSLFLKQPFINFIIFNIIIAILIYLSYFIKDKILNYFKESSNIKNFIALHNNFLFIFLALILYCWFK